MQMSYVTDEQISAVGASGSNGLDWNYTKQGTDWNNTYQYCSIEGLNKSARGFSQQSPATVNISYEKNLNWQDDAFSFVPYFYSTKISSYSTDKLVFTINLSKVASGKFFGIQAIE